MGRVITLSDDSVLKQTAHDLHDKCLINSTSCRQTLDKFQPFLDQLSFRLNVTFDKLSY